MKRNYLNTIYLALSLLLASAISRPLVAGTIKVEIAFQNISATFNGVPNTSFGQHKFTLLVDDTTPDLVSSTAYGGFATLSTKFTAPDLGLIDVNVLNPTYLFTNSFSGGQIALRFNAPHSTFSNLYGQFSPLGLPSYMSDNNDLNTINTNYSESSTGGQWRTNVNGGLNLNLASGDYIDGGQSIDSGTSTVTISTVPDTGSTALLLGAGLLGLAAVRRKMGRS